MPISDQFVNEEAPEWTWGDPSQLTAAQTNAEDAQAATTSDTAGEADGPVGPPWLDALMGGVIFLVSQLVVGLIALIVFVIVALPKDLDVQQVQALAKARTLATEYPALTPSILIPVSISAILMVWGWCHVGNRNPKDLINWGFKKVDLLWGLGTLIFSILVGNITSMILQVPPAEAAQLNNALWSDTITLPIALISAVCIGILVPISEEMIFRGLIQNATARRFNDWVGLIVASLIFALPHAANFLQLDVSFASMAAGMIQVTILGFVIGGIFIYTRRLGACIAAHVFNNSLAVASLIYVTFFAG